MPAIVMAKKTKSGNAFFITDGLFTYKKIFIFYNFYF